MWNHACIVKLVWAVAIKKDLLWVRWVYGRYLKTIQWWDFKPPTDAYWYLKKPCRMKYQFKWGSTPNKQKHPQGKYTVSTGYLWSLNVQKRERWARYVWSKACIPRQAIIWWLVMRSKLPVKKRLSKYMQIDTGCRMCNEEEEDHNHVFITCSFAKTVGGGYAVSWAFKAPEEARNYGNTQFETRTKYNFISARQCARGD